MPVDTTKIKKLREERGLSLAAAAKAAGLRSRQAWHGIETGAYSPTVETLEKVAAALGVKATALLK
jgi:transcriptional regulator with XRE-family HTH domain